MNDVVLIPGPEFVTLLGVHFPLLSTLFGIAGVGLGHLMTPVPAVPIGWRRTVAIVLAGMALSATIAIATGQRPLVVLGWSIGIGFSGQTLFAAIGGQVVAGARTIGDALVDKIAAQVAARRDK